MTAPSTRRRLSPESRQALILEAAEAHLAQVGPGAFSPEVVATDAGVSPALVRHYFGGREQLLATLAEHLSMALVAIFEDPRLDPKERALQYLSFLQSRPWSHALWLSRGAGGGPQAERIVAEARERLVAAAARGIGGRHARFWGLALTGAIESVVEEWLGEESIDLQARAEELVRLQARIGLGGV